MPTIVGFTESDVFAVLRGWLLSVVPTTTEIVRSQVNRVPPPRNTNYIAMTPLLRTRLATNVDAVTDVAFVGSIADTTLTVSTLISGNILVGTVIDGIGVLPGTAITAVPPGAITVSQSQTVLSTTMYSGYKVAIQSVQFDVQLDIHGPASAESTAAIATLFRDEYATQWFDDSGLDAQPLYAGEPRQMPFVNAESQYEERWTVDLSLQVNQTIQIPQQFADTLTPDLVSVEAEYPA